MTDDQITDAIAAEIVQRVEQTHKAPSPEFLERIVRLYTLQSVGWMERKPSNKKLARRLRTDPQRLSEDFKRALKKARRTYEERFPEDVPPLDS